MLVLTVYYYYLYVWQRREKKVISSIQIINIPFSARRTLGIWDWWGRNRSQSIGTFRNIGGGIQIRKSKIYLNEVALRIGCRNMFWSQCFNQKLSGWTTLGPAIVVLAALVSRAACTIMAVPKVVQPVRLIKFWLKHCDQGIFLHSILSATSFK